MGNTLGHLDHNHGGGACGGGGGGGDDGGVVDLHRKEKLKTPYSWSLEMSITCQEAIFSLEMKIVCCLLPTCQVFHRF